MRHQLQKRAAFSVCDCHVTEEFIVPARSCLDCAVLQGSLMVDRSWRQVQRMVSHGTVRWEGGKVHLSLEIGLM